MSKEKPIVVKGKVSEASGGGIFKVQLDSGHEIIAHPSGKMRMHNIRILPNDSVTIEMSPYDLTRGRIIKRTLNK